MPRVPKMTQEMQDQFCGMVAVGCTRRTAAHLVGCAESTVRSTLVRDEAFAKKVKAAERQREIVPLRNVHVAGQKYWRAAAWFLERLNPEVYGRRKPREITPAELAEVIDRFAEVVTARISSPEDRRAVHEGIDQIQDELRRQTESWDVAQPARRSGSKSRTTQVPHIGVRDDSPGIRAAEPDSNAANRPASPPPAP
jgi:hypothetical protein